VRRGDARRSAIIFLLLQEELPRGGGSERRKPISTAMNALAPRTKNADRARDHDLARPTDYSRALRERLPHIGFMQESTRRCAPCAPVTTYAQGLAQRCKLPAN